MRTVTEILDLPIAVTSYSYFLRTYVSSK